MKKGVYLPDLQIVLRDPEQIQIAEEACVDIIPIELGNPDLESDSLGTLCWVDNGDGAQAHFFDLDVRTEDPFLSCLKTLTTAACVLVTLVVFILLLI